MFIESFAKAGSSSSRDKEAERLWPHLHIVGGLLEVVGFGQPANPAVSGFTKALLGSLTQTLCQRCGPEMMRRPARGGQLQTVALQARVMKAIHDIGEA